MLLVISAMSYFEFVAADLLLNTAWSSYQVLLSKDNLKNC